MQSQVHQIRSPKLKPFIQYILYNRQDDDVDGRSVTSFPNTNICLGVSKDNILSKEGPSFVGRSSPESNIFTYTTGLYNAPHELKVPKKWDEICIDFSPCGYYHFFNTPSRPKIIQQGFSDHIFNEKDQRVLLAIFEETDLRNRSAGIENLLLSKLRPFEKSNLQLAIAYIHARGGAVTVKELLVNTGCSERKLYRLFMDHFGTTPKWYIRILKIRKAIKLMAFAPRMSLTEVSYRCGYSDQSHFIKEARSLCHVLPTTLKNSLTSIDNEVIIKNF